MAKIHVDISDVENRKAIEKILLSSGHEPGTFVPGTKPSPDIVLTDSIASTGDVARFKKMDVYSIVLGPETSDPREIASFDDFLVLPVKSEELLLRLAVAISKSTKIEEEVLKVDGLSVNFETYEVFADVEMLDLTYKEFELLKYLIENSGRVLTRDKLLDKVWGYEYFGGTRTVDVHIRRLRAKLGVRYEDYIETIRNVGYRFRKTGR